MNKLLPIGSVVSSNDEEDLFVIVGYYPEIDDRSYDYLVAAFPQGLFEVAAFECLDEAAIDEVLFTGYQDQHGEQALEAARGYMDAVGERNTLMMRAILDWVEGNSPSSEIAQAGTLAADEADPYNLE